MKSIKSLNNPCLRSLIGNTPLIKISPHIYAKLETYSPAGSVKDRMVQYIVERSRIFGKIDEDSILCEATSGNTGISLSMMAASLGVQCVIFMPSNMSEERRQMMKIYGAKIIDAPASDFQGAIAMRDQYLLANKNAWSPKQFSNNYNTLYHQTTTAPEIAASRGGNPSKSSTVGGTSTRETGSLTSPGSTPAPEMMSGTCWVASKTKSPWVSSP